jgi:hypothetical protein
MEAVWAAIPPVTSTATASIVPPSQPSVTVKPNPIVTEDIGDLGKSTLWVVFAIMLISSIGFIGLSWKVAVPKRLFATLSYYAMASGTGYDFHVFDEEIKHKHDLPSTYQEVHRK